MPILRSRLLPSTRLIVLAFPLTFNGYPMSTIIQISRLNTQKEGHTVTQPALLLPLAPDAVTGLTRRVH